MAFQTPITIYKALGSIECSEYVLPAIQREFVWEPPKIVRLFDSLMRGYPIGSFLFWQVERGSISWPISPLWARTPASLTPRSPCRFRNSSIS